MRILFGFGAYNLRFRKILHYHLIKVNYALIINGILFHYYSGCRGPAIDILYSFGAIVC